MSGEYRPKTAVELGSIRGEPGHEYRVLRGRIQVVDVLGLKSEPPLIITRPSREEILPMGDIEEIGPGVIDPDLDLELPTDVFERGRRVAYYLEQLAEELPDAMHYAGSETFTWLHESAKKIGEIAAQEMTRTELD